MEPELKVVAGAGTQADPAKLAGQAFASMHRLLTSLELAPGSVVTERELAEQVGLGKVPVREALQQLSMTGLIRPRSGAGYEVAPVTLRDARDLFDTWRVIEPAAAAIAVSRGAEEKVLEVLGRALRGDDPRLAELDPFQLELLVHVWVVSAAQVHRLLWTMSLQIQPHAERLMRFASKLGARFDLGHDEIVAALRGSDPDAAREAVTSHIDALERRVMDALVRSAAAQDVNLGG